VIRVDIDSLILHRAEQIRRAENILPPGAQDRSISGKGDRAVWCGAIGQAVFERAMEEYEIAFGTDAVITHDYRVPVGRLEVKTKERSVQPRPDYEGSAYAYNQAWQRPDWIGFVSLKFAPGYDKASAPTLEKYEAGWVMGCIPYDRFSDKAFIIEKGGHLPNGQEAGFVSLNIEYHALESIEALRGGEND
jgi:hypothetical protein